MNSNRDGVDIICRTSHGWPIPIAPSQASGRRQCRQVTCAGEVDGGNHDDWKNSPRKFRWRGPHSEDESDDHDTRDMEMAQETAMDLSVAKAVKQLLDEGAKEPQPSPTEVFDEIYQAIKQRKNGTTVESPEQMLRKLFPDDPTNDIFDERKVMIKLRSMMDQEDFDKTFKDPVVGDWL